MHEDKSVNKICAEIMQWLDTISHFDQNRKKK